LTHLKNIQTIFKEFCLYFFVPQNVGPIGSAVLAIILFCLRLVKSHTPQRFVLRHCLKNLAMGNPVNHSEHLFYALAVILTSNLGNFTHKAGKSV